MKSITRALPTLHNLALNLIIGHDREREIVLETIPALPDDCSLEEIVERIEFMAAVQKGLDQLDRGEGIPHDEVKRQLAFILMWPALLAIVISRLPTRQQVRNRSPRSFSILFLTVSLRKYIWLLSRERHAPHIVLEALSTNTNCRAA